ncbi:hypothetical protein V8F20_011388 [Naviculisporaceae sp. PSN 640]
MKSNNLAFYLAHAVSVAGAAAGAAAEIPPAAASPLAEAATKTRTKIWSTTESSVTFNQWIYPHKATLYTTKTVTSFEPRPTFTSYPGTVIQTVISHVRLEDRYTYSDGRTTTSTTAYVATVPETWVVSKPTAAAKPLTGTRPGSLACKENKDGSSCHSPAQNEDPICQAAGLKTGCQGQCVRHEEDDEWWCYMMHQRDYVYPELRMGRACWGAGLRFRQLNVPCLEGDLGMGCVACEGLDYTWGAVNWEGPEARD